MKRELVKRFMFTLHTFCSGLKYNVDLKLKPLSMKKNVADRKKQAKALFFFY